MITKIFKTKKIAEEYLHKSYPGIVTGDLHTQWTTISEKDDWEGVDMPNLSWSGEQSALLIENRKGETIDIVSWLEDSENIYEISVNGTCVAFFDNLYDAQESYTKHIKEAEYDDDIQDKCIKLVLNGEEIMEHLH